MNPSIMVGYRNVITKLRYFLENIEEENVNLRVRWLIKSRYPKFHSLGYLENVLRIVILIY
jgi:hypothetical protein